jgi:hypothetical protein
MTEDSGYFHFPFSISYLTFTDWPEAAFQMTNDKWKIRNVK